MSHRIPTPPAAPNIYCAACGTQWVDGVPGCSCAAPAVSSPTARFTRVDVSDAYGHALTGNVGMGVVAALVNVVASLERIRAALDRLARDPCSTTCPSSTAVLLNLTVQLTDKGGNPVAIIQGVDPTRNDLHLVHRPDERRRRAASPAGPVVWTSSLPLEPAADGLSCKARVNSEGVFTVSVTDGTSHDECQVISQVVPVAPVALNITADLIGKGE